MAGKKGASGRRAGRTQYSDDVRSLAKSYFVLERKTIAEIALLLGVPVNTIRGWKTADDWDSSVLPRAASGKMIAAELLVNIHNILEEAKKAARTLTVEEADAIVKLQSTANKLDPKGQFKAHAMDTVQALGDYLRKYAPSLHPQVVPHLLEFIRRVVEEPLL